MVSSSEKRRLRVSEGKALRKYFDPKEVTK
jgi:hypothetical protein